MELEVSTTIEHYFDLLSSGSSLNRERVVYINESAFPRTLQLNRLNYSRDAQIAVIVPLICNAKEQLQDALFVHHICGNVEEEKLLLYWKEFFALKWPFIYIQLAQLATLLKSRVHT